MKPAGQDGGSELSAVQRRYLRTETLVSAIANALMSLAAAALAMHGAVQLPTWGVGGVAFSVAPQSFMVVFMTTLVTTLMARQRLRTGAIEPLAPQAAGPLRRAPRAPIVRAVVFAVPAAALLSALIAIALAQSHVVAFSAIDYLVASVLYGCVLAIVATPFIARAALAAT